MAAPVVAHQAEVLRERRDLRRPTCAAWCRASSTASAPGLLSGPSTSTVDRAAVRLDRGHRVSPNWRGCFIAVLCYHPTQRAEPDAPGHPWTADFDGLGRWRGGVRPHGAGLSEISRRHGGAARRGARGRWRVRPRALPEGLFRAAVLQAGERAGGGRGGAGGAAPDRERDARASTRMWRRSRPGSPAISTARSACGSRS